MLSSGDHQLHFLPHEPSFLPDHYFPLSHTSVSARFLPGGSDTFPMMNMHNMSIRDYIINPAAIQQNNSNYSPSSLSSSTSDEADEQQMRIIDERKQRRMISNRESARRSRMRKQKHLDELWSQVVRLRNDNHSLLDRLNRLSESHDRVVEENARLKEEASGLRQMLTDLPIGSPYSNESAAAALKELDDVVRADHQSSSNDSSVDLLL